MNEEWFLIAILFLCILFCFWGLIGSKLVTDAGGTCKTGIGFFCWFW